jgi:hypothetical protein
VHFPQLRLPSLQKSALWVSHQFRFTRIPWRATHCSLAVHMFRPWRAAPLLASLHFPRLRFTRRRSAPLCRNLSIRVHAQALLTEVAFLCRGSRAAGSFLTRCFFVNFKLDLLLSVTRPIPFECRCSPGTSIEHVARLSSRCLQLSQQQLLFSTPLRYICRRSRLF